MRNEIRNSDFISIGIVINAQGIKGELKIYPITDEPEQFEDLEFIYLSTKGVRKRYQVQHVRFTNKHVVIKLEGIDDRTTAENLKNSLIERKLSELRPLDENEYYIFDLIGLTVITISGESRGQIVDVLTNPANDVYVVSDGSNEYFVPAIKDVVKKIDLGAGEMVIDPIDGMFE
ncbi:16S rRNA processing protein RimM [candidate division KSB1 bacterium]|nr:16S rRNA processing protein RimM [candidate division KSB1 bacterium]